MAWDSLLKIYYKNQNQPEVLASIYRERFASPFAKHVDFAIRQYNRPTSWPAFYYYTDEIIELLVNINKENGVLQQLKHAMPDIGLKSFYISSMMDEIISTNDIENVNSTKREISLALDKLKNKHSNVRLSHVVSKYKKLIKKEVVYFDNCRDIRTFYDEFVLDEIIRENESEKPDGELFRKDPVRITGAADKTIQEGLFPETEVLQQLQKALNFLHDIKEQPLVRIAIFHYLFGYIHPFYNGNGRTSRFISSYYLGANLDILVGLRLSITIKKNVGGYYEIFKNTTNEFNRGDLTPFIVVFLNFVYQTVKELNTEMRSKLVELNQKLQKIKAIFAQDETMINIYFFLLQAALFSPNGISVDEIIEASKKSRATILNRMKLIPKEHLLIDAEQRPKRYKLNVDKALE